MRRMAKQQNKTLAQATSGRAGQALAAAAKASKLSGSASDDSMVCGSEGFRGMDANQASVFKDCYNSMLKQAETGLSAQDALMSDAQAPKKANSKRKRKDLRICTAGGSGSECLSSGGMFLPDTPRRVLHTQLLLQLLNNSSDDTAHLGKIDSVFFARVTSATHAKSKKRNIGKKGAKGLPPLITNDPTSGHTLAELDAFEHLDMDFNEVQLCPSHHRRVRA